MHSKDRQEVREHCNWHTRPGKGRKSHEPNDMRQGGAQGLDAACNARLCVSLQKFHSGKGVVTYLTNNQ